MLNEQQLINKIKVYNNFIDVDKLKKHMNLLKVRMQLKKDILEILTSAILSQ